jgi:hypothetical protein
MRLGVVVLPNHYYCGVPDLRVLARKRENWARRSALPGISIDLDDQARSLRKVCLPFEPEYRGNQVYHEACTSDCGPGFGYIEAQALYAFIRHYKPRLAIEVGSGVSTFCMLGAAARNSRECDRVTRFISMEPYPRPWLRSAPISLIDKPVQDVPLEVFESLGPGDFLFVDSSHAVCTGGDVNFLVLEVLPRLRPGVLVHFHDIYLPYDYPRDALCTLSQAQETALLHAFLIGNSGVRIVFSLSHLHYDCKDVLHEVFPEYRPQRDQEGLTDACYKPFAEIPEHFPSSTYLQIIG